MKMKEYIPPVCNVFNVQRITLLSGSSKTDVPYDPNTNTGEALSPFLDIDEF